MAVAPQLPLPTTNQPVTQLFRKLETVGKGAYGSVHRGIHIPSGCVVALKIINLDTTDDVSEIQGEIALLSRLNGGDQCNVTRYWGCWLEGANVWIAMDYAAGGSIRTLMKAGKIEERYTAVVIRETLVGVSFLHRQNIIHRDIKAANILLTSAGRVMLCDFGVSALLPSANSKRMTMAGTVLWMAPEVISPSSSYDTKADIWSLGSTVYEIATGDPPMRANPFVVMPNTPPPVLPPQAGSEEMREFVAACLREKPSDRLTADDLLKHKWLKPYAKKPVSLLKELILRYKTWEENGGVRKSIVDLDNEADIIDDDFEGDEISAWEFDGATMRSTRMPISSAAADEAEMATPITANTANPWPRSAPRSLRMLFQEGSEPPPPPEEMMRSPPSRRRQATPQPFLGDPPSSSTPGAFDGQTVRALNFSFPPKPPGTSALPSPAPSFEPLRSTTPISGGPRSASPNGPRSHSPLPSEPPPQLRRSPKSRSNSPPASPQSTVRNKRRAATMDSKNAPLAPPSLPFPPTQPPPMMSPSKPGLSGWSFPTAPGSGTPARPRAPSSPAPPPRDLQIPGPAPPLPTPLVRANSAVPWSTMQPKSESTETLISPMGGTAGLLRRPSLARIGSAMAAMETAPAAAATLPPMSSIETLLALPDPVAAKDGKMSPLSLPKPEYASSDPDFLPPSPTLMSHPTQPHLAPQTTVLSNTSQLTVSTLISSAPSSARPSRNNSTSTFTTAASPMHSPQPLYKPLTMPSIRPLDYAQLGTSEAVHAELARTVEALRDWMGLVEHALSGVLDIEEEAEN